MGLFYQSQVSGSEECEMLVLPLQVSTCASTTRGAKLTYCTHKHVRSHTRYSTSISNKPQELRVFYQNSAQGQLMQSVFQSWW